MEGRDPSPDSGPWKGARKARVDGRVGLGRKEVTWPGERSLLQCRMEQRKKRFSGGRGKPFSP